MGKKKSTPIKAAKGKNFPAGISPAVEPALVYRPGDIALNVRKLFPQEHADWQNMASDSRYLRLRPSVSLGIVGLQGSLSLGEPPSPEDFYDGWEGSRPKNHWGYQKFLDFISVPVAGKPAGLEVIFFHAQHSFQERPLEVVAKLILPRCSYEKHCIDQPLRITEMTDAEKLAAQWKRLGKALAGQFGSADLKKQKWTVDGRTYDITYPDD